MVIDYALYLSLVLVVWTKFLDCYSTHKFIGEDVEKNPIPKLLKKYFSINFYLSIWLIFAFVVFLSVVIAFLNYYMIENFWAKVSIIFYLSVGSYFQFGAYVFNSRNKAIPGISLILRLFNLLKK